MAVLVPDPPLVKVHEYDFVTEPIAGTVTLVPSVTKQDPPGMASVMVTPVKSTSFGLVTLIEPDTIQLLSTKPFGVTLTE